MMADLLGLRVGEGLAPSLISASASHEPSSYGETRTWAVTFVPSADYFLGNGWSIGGMAGLSIGESSTTTTYPEGTTGEYHGSQLDVIAAPRIGKYFPVGDRMGIWVRASIGPDVRHRTSRSTWSNGANDAMSWDEVLLYAQADASLLARLVGPLVVKAGPSATALATLALPNNIGMLSQSVSFGLTGSLGLAF